MIPHRDFNKGLWSIVSDLKQAASIRYVPYETVNHIREKLESLLRAHHVFNLNSVPSKEFTGAIFHMANIKLGDYVPEKPRKRSSKDAKLLKSLNFWVTLARDIRFKRRSESDIAASLGLSLEELAQLKDELKDKGWFD